ncbi:MAG TPA: universal stress protein [Chitinophagaceae bacterium]|nr:universal stress protein [Chitinophagaceae bacterium]
MKTLVVPTDFSPVAVNAMNYALNLAKDINAEVVLFHAYQVPVAFSEVPVVTISLDEMKKQSDEKMEDLRNSVQHITSGEVSIRIHNVLGDTVEELEIYCNKEKPFAIIMGTHGAGAFETLFLGSTTISTINRLRCPIMIIPPGATFKPIHNIGFACDYSQVAESTPIEEIKKWVALFNARIRVLNVDYNNRQFNPNVPLSLTKVHDLLEPLNPEFHYIDDPDVEEGINTFAETHGIDLLITIPKKHKLLEKIFQRSRTRSLALHAHVPILAIHE